MFRCSDGPISSRYLSLFRVILHVGYYRLPLALAFPNPYQSRDRARYSQSDQSPENRSVILVEEAENFAAIAPGQERKSEVAYSARRAHREHQVASRVVESPCGDGER